MNCPYCDSSTTSVTDTRPLRGGANVRRRRECGECGERFTTYEALAEANLSVRKRSGSVEPYDRTKLRAGVEAACAKLANISPSDIDDLVWGVELQLYRLRRDHIESELIGEAVMERLKELDEVAYIRFASVYRDFKEAEDFHKAALKLIK